jgi:hypothetical protein
MRPLDPSALTNKINYLPNNGDCRFAQCGHCVGKAVAAWPSPQQTQTYGTGSSPNSHGVSTTNHGTYVQPHQQTNPNNTRRGSVPNVEPLLATIDQLENKPKNDRLLAGSRPHSAGTNVGSLMQALSSEPFHAAISRALLQAR